MKVAILGGGQLARMLSMAAHRLGMEPWVVDPKPDAPAAPVARHVVGALDDEECLRAVSQCDVATAEIDHAPGSALEWLSQRIPVLPGPQAFAVAGDRLREKRLFHRLGIETARFAPVDRASDIGPALSRVGSPAILKTRFEGYDGKGQRPVRSESEALRAWKELGGASAILEQRVAFDREISILAVRGLDGDVRFWSPVHNHHEHGILRHSRPLDLGPDDPLLQQAHRSVGALLSALEYVGVLAVEFFEVEGRLLANELACRVHNSGHWTEDAAETGQFENHLRAIAGWPLGGTRLLGPTALVNLIGDVPSRDALLSLPGARLHLYGKEPAPGRKLGHVTLRAERTDLLELEPLKAALRSSERDEVVAS